MPHSGKTQVCSGGAVPGMDRPRSLLCLCTAHRVLPRLCCSLDCLESVHLGDSYLFKTWLKLGKQQGETVGDVITCILHPLGWKHRGVWHSIIYPLEELVRSAGLAVTLGTPRALWKTRCESVAYKQSWMWGFSRCDKIALVAVVTEGNQCCCRNVVLGVSKKPSVGFSLHTNSFWFCPSSFFPSS